MHGIERSTIFYAFMFVIVLLIVFAVVTSPTVQGDPVKNQLKLQTYCLPWMQAYWSTTPDTLAQEDLAYHDEQHIGLKKACSNYVGNILGSEPTKEDWEKCKNNCMSVV